MTATDELIMLGWSVALAVGIGVLFCLILFAVMWFIAGPRR